MQDEALVCWSILVARSIPYRFKRRLENGDTVSDDLCIVLGKHVIFQLRMASPSRSNAYGLTRHRLLITMKLLG